MLTTNQDLLAKYKELSREINGSVQVYDEDAALSLVLSPGATLMSFLFEKSAPNGKFFGFAEAQKLTIKVLGKLDLESGIKLVPTLTAGSDAQVFIPNFFPLGNTCSNRSDIRYPLSTILFSNSSSSI